MTDAAPDQHASTPGADSNRDELVERLKRENAALMEQKAQADTRASAFEAKERTRVAAWQPEVKHFLNEFVVNECCADDAEAKADVQAVVNWGEEYASKSDIASQTSLARVCAMASKGVKRIREDASQLSGVQDSLANALKENEELKASAEKMQRESTDDKKLLDERQAQLEKLNARIAELGGDRFNFSNAAAREVAPPAEPIAAIKPEAGLTAVSAQASKSAGNPTADDSLFSFISNSGGGSLRMGASNTNHALLGNAGEPDIASILRSGKQYPF